MLASEIRIKRVYETPDAKDGRRVLVDRLWPRGLSRDDAAVDAWPKTLAPSPELRRWFGHEPSRFGEFRRRYLRELEAHAVDARALLDEAGDEPLTLLYAARDAQHNHARVLAEFLRSVAAAAA